MKTAKKAGFLKSLAVPIGLSLEAILNPAKAQIPVLQEGSKTSNLTLTAPETTYWVNTKKEYDNSPDYDRDRKITFTDFVLFARAFNTDNVEIDLTGDGFVHFEDFIRFAQAYGKDVNSTLSSTKPAKLTASQLKSLVSYSNPDSAYSIDLSEIVKDDVFGDPITFSVNDTKGLVAKLVPNKDGKLSKVIFRPLGTYNSTDNGNAELEYRAVKEGAQLTDKEEIEIARDDSLMQLYNEVRLDQKLIELPREVYIYKRKRAAGDPINPALWTGPELTKEEIDMIKDGTYKFFDFMIETGYFQGTPNIVIGNDASKFYAVDAQGEFYDIPAEERRAVFLWDNNILGIGETVTSPINSNKIESFFISLRNGADLSVILHEYGDHVSGKKHADSFTEGQSNYSVKPDKNKLSYFPLIDRAVNIIDYDNK